MSRTPTRNLFVALASWLVMGFFSAVFGELAIESSWPIIAGSDPLEKTAASELAAELNQRHGLQLTVAGFEKAAARRAVIIGTVSDNPLIAAEHAREPFQLKADEAESYHSALRGGKLFIVGQSPKGAMNGAFRFADRRSLDVTDLDIKESPAFHFRVGGHKINQHPPAGYTDEDQARYYARHYINVVWGEKMGAPLSAQSRAKYGLGLMAELRFPPRTDDLWLNAPANASSVYRLSSTQAWRVIDPFDPAGKQAYLDGFRDLLKMNPDTRILYGTFGDYNAIPDEKSIRVSDGKPYEHSREEGIKEVLSLMRQAVGERDILTVAWLWHAFYGRENEEVAFMKELGSLGYGIIYNEAGNNDCWLIKRNNFNVAALATGPDKKTPYGPQYLPLVSLGGACESINPVIGLPLPHVAAIKLRKLADIGVRHFCTWWAGWEGWVYEPNNEVISEMIWNPAAFDSENPQPFDPKTGDPLLRRIAARDFGPDLASDVLEFWRRFDHAIVTTSELYKPVGAMPPPETDGLHLLDWYQRMGIFTEETSFGGPVHLPLTPANLSGRKEVKEAKEWIRSPQTISNYEAVLKNLDLALDQIEAIRKKPMPADISKRVSEMAQWSALYRRLLETQYHYFQAIAVMVRHQGDALDSPAIRQELTPINQAEIANGEKLIQLIPGFAPNFNIRLNLEQVWADSGSQQNEIAAIRGKASAMRIWMRQSPNLALHCAATASSTASPDKPAQAALDGNDQSRWVSNASDHEWLSIDLGKAQNIRDFILRWSPGYAKAYEIQISNDGDLKSWTPVYQTEHGNGGVETISLPKPIPARFIRLNGMKRGTDWGYGIIEFEVYGD